MTSIRGRDYPAQRSQASKISTSLLSNKSNNRDYKHPLRSNKPEPSKAFARPFETPAEALSRPFQAPPLAF